MSERQKQSASYGNGMIAPTLRLACPDDEELAQFVERGLPEARRAEIDVHCEACPRCLEAVAFLVEAFAEPRSEPEAGHRAPPLPARGTTLGRYVILEFIGAGAMGAVYSAFDPQLDRRVAIKLLPPRSQEDDPDHRARFVAEARAMASVSHPNVIAVHDVGTHGDYAFFAMELVEGGTLASWLAGDTRTTPEIIAVFEAAARGLAAAHAGRLVHRDFKPNNVLVGNDGRVRVIDFGLARFAVELSTTGRPEARQLLGAAPDTRTGALIGTPAYMAPEQLARGKSDARADQFAFCVSLHEALYGRRPFDGDTVAELADAIERGPLPPATGPRRVPRRLQRLLTRGLSAKPEHRYASMRALAAQLTARPLARWGPVAAVVVAVAGTAFGIHGAVAGTAGSLCRPDPEPLAGVWDKTQRAALLQAMATDAPTPAADTPIAQWLAERFDAYAHSWGEVNQEVCVATLERHEHSAATMDLQLACLRRAKAQLRAHVGAMIAGGPALLQRAVAVVESLPPLGVCTDAETLTAGPSPPTPAQAQAVQAQRAVIAEAYASWATGDFRGSIARAREVEARAESIGYEPLSYEAVLLLGEASARISDHSVAQEALERALDASLAASDWPVAIHAAAALSCLASADIGQPLVGLAYGRTAVGLARQSDGLGESRVHALRCMGRALKQMGKLGEAEMRQRQAVAELERDAGEHEVLVANARVDLGQTLVLQGRLQEAKAEFSVAVTVFEREFGPMSPVAVLAAAARASVMADQGDFDAAEAEYRRLVQVWGRAAGSRSPNIGIVQSKLGNLLYDQHRYEEAGAAFRAGREILLETLGETHPISLAVEGSLANVLTRTGRLPEARDAYREVLGRFEAAFPARHPTAVQLRTALARVEFELGDFVAARRTLGPADAACDEGSDVPAELCGNGDFIAAQVAMKAGDRATASARLAAGKQRYATSEILTDEVRAVIASLEADLSASE